MYNSANIDISKSDRALSDDWFSKIKQVFEKANKSFYGTEDYATIQRLYHECYLVLDHPHVGGCFLKFIYHIY